MSAFVRFEGVTKSYDGQSLVVKALDLEVRRGEFLTLLGPSGSGKTTTLMMLAGFETPTSGRILLEDKAITSLPPYKRDIGMVFQNYALFPHMSVADNVGFPLTVRRIAKPEIAHRVATALEMVKLGALGHRRPAQLSGGQQQRVALARALVYEPKLVLLDEPLGALDKQLREEMQYELKHLHQSLGVTMIYVTHDQAEALTMSDRIAVFHDGLVQQIDGPKALYQQPANAFVSKFIGESNQLAGRLMEQRGGSCSIEVGDGQRIVGLPVGLSDSRAVTVAIRPERLRIDSSEPAENRFPGRIEELVYLGDVTRIRLSLLGRDDLFVKLPNDRGELSLEPGAEVSVSWRGEDARVFPAD